MFLVNTRQWIVDHHRLLGYGTVFFGVSIYVWLMHAWISDDALITVREVFNFIHGYGIVWNLGERVQAFTHPLWFILISGISAVTGTIYQAIYILSFVCTMIACGQLFDVFSQQRNKVFIVMLLFLLFSSRAFWDFSSSGLENPLSYCIGIWLVKNLPSDKIELRHWLVGMVLLFFNRPDAVVIFLPMAIYFWRDEQFNFKPILLPLLLLLLYMIGSIFYFGSPLPNSMIAKMLSPYTFSQAIFHGFEYFDTLLVYDTITALVISSYVVLALLGQNNRDQVLAQGIVLYSLCILYIGGDFMMGRFFALPFVLSLYCLAQFKLSNLKILSYLLAIVLSVLYCHLPPVFIDTLAYGNNYPEMKGLDERYFYFNHFSLFHSNNLPPVRLPSEHPIKRGDIHYVCGGAGYYRLMNDGYVVDYCGLASPYLSHVRPIKANFRPGHFYRRISVLFENWLLREDVVVERWQLYSDIRMVVSGPLWSVQRFKSLLRTNFGFFRLASFDPKGRMCENSDDSLRKSHYCSDEKFIEKLHRMQV